MSEPKFQVGDVVNLENLPIVDIWNRGRNNYCYALGVPNNTFSINVIDEHMNECATLIARKKTKVKKWQWLFKNINGVFDTTIKRYATWEGACVEACLYWDQNYAPTKILESEIAEEE